MTSYTRKEPNPVRIYVVVDNRLKDGKRLYPDHPRDWLVKNRRNSTIATRCFSRDQARDMARNMNSGALNPSSV